MHFLLRISSLAQEISFADPKHLSFIGWNCFASILKKYISSNILKLSSSSFLSYLLTTCNLILPIHQQIAESGINLDAIPITDAINTTTTTKTYRDGGSKVTETNVTKTISQTVRVAPAAEAQKRPHEDTQLKRQFDGELGSLVSWMEDTEHKLMSSGEPSPEDHNLDEQMKFYSVSNVSN